MPDDKLQRPRRNWRSAGRPATPRVTARFDDDGVESRAPRPPSMSRSRAQLATTYAPGVLFTWEGAKGICRAVPIEREALNVAEATKLLIFDGIREIAANWFARGNDVRNPDPVEIDLVLDDVFYDPHSQAVEPNWNRDFQLTEPGVMGYVPYPLLYKCALCGHLQEYESIAEQARRPLPPRCGDHLARWTQVDVVYVHWSGGLEPLSPFKNNYDMARNSVAPIRQCTCGSQDFRLLSQTSEFSGWRFICESCGVARDLKQPDALTLGVLERVQRAGGRTFQRIEVNMLPVSYRANSAFYPQKGTFIEFRDRSVVDLLLPARQGELLQLLAETHRVPFTQPTDQQIEAALNNADRGSEWNDYREFLSLASRISSVGKVEKLRQDAAEMKEGWYRDALIERGAVQSEALAQAVFDRKDWARRYDPVRLTLEHQRFVVEHIDERRSQHEAINVLEPDRLICESIGDPSAMARYQDEIGGLLQRIGVEQLELIRGLPICEFSFGFSRVSSTPIYLREFNGRQEAMPVRLNAFPELPNNRRPVYVTQQKNEALYFRLNELRMRRWLRANGIEQIEEVEDRTLGASYLERYTDFKAFLEEFKEREGRGTVRRGLAAYTYLLLHSMAHQVMHAIADTSGLDRDQLGEYLFPADLGFVVYRKGMTPDLGNVSAMWRNRSSEFLRRILDQRMLRCGSGTLCDTRGGACPACIMVSEVTCIAGNQLLSRAALRGGPAPLWEPTSSAPLIGYFDPRLLT